MGCRCRVVSVVNEFGVTCVRNGGNADGTAGDVGREGVLVDEDDDHREGFGLHAGGCQVDHHAVATPTVIGVSEAFDGDPFCLFGRGDAVDALHVAPVVTVRRRRLSEQAGPHRRVGRLRLLHEREFVAQLESPQAHSR